MKLKLPKLSLFTLTFLSAFGYANTPTDNNEKTYTKNEKPQLLDLKNKSIIEKSSYSLGAIMAEDLYNLIDKHKGIIEYDKYQILLGIQDTLNDKKSLNDKEIETNLFNLFFTINQISEHSNIGQQPTTIEEDFNTKFIKKYKEDPEVKTTQSGLNYKIISTNNNTEKPKPNNNVTVKYTGYLANGNKFDETPTPITLNLSNTIEGWKEGLQLIGKNEKIELVIPPHLGYGNSDLKQIPKNSILIFHIELIDFN